MGYLVFCLAYSFDLDGVPGVLIGIVLVGALGVFVIGTVYLLYEHENLVFRMVYLVLSS